MPSPLDAPSDDEPGATRVWLDIEYTLATRNDGERSWAEAKDVVDPDWCGFGMMRDCTFRSLSSIGSTDAVSRSHRRARHAVRLRPIPLDMSADTALLLLPQRFKSCPVCGGQLRHSSTSLTIHGPETLEATIEVDRCANCDRTYVPVAKLFDILQEAGWMPDEATGFEVAGQPTSVEMLTGPDGSTEPWDTFVEVIQPPSKQPLPSLEDVRALPERAVVWEINARPVAWFNDDQGQPTIGHALVIVDDDGRIRQYDVTDHVPNADDVANLLLRAAVKPDDGGKSFRPAQLHTSQHFATDAVAARLADVGVELCVAPTPLANDALEALLESMQEGAPPFLSAYREDEVRAFFEAARTFYNKEPWRFFEGTSHAAFRLDNGPWRYVNVMGQMGQDPGISVYDDWLHLCRFVSNSAGVGGADDDAIDSALSAVGAAEAVTLNPLTSMHPEDGAYVMDLGLEPVSGNLYPMAYRIEAGGITGPSLPLPTYRKLLEALADIVAPNRKNPFDSFDRTVDVDGVNVVMRYPAQGNENYERSSAFQLVIDSAAFRGEGTGMALKRGQNITVVAPGNTPFLVVVYEVLEESNEELMITALGHDDHLLWQLDPSTADTCPHLYQLDGFDDLWVDIDGAMYDLELMPRLGNAKKQVSAVISRQL